MPDADADLAAALQRVARSDRDALRCVYDLSAGRLFTICLRVCDDRGAAEDVLQEVYLTVWQRAHRFDGSRGSAMAWLAAIARHRAIDWRRARASPPAQDREFPIELADPAPTVGAVALLNDRSRLLHESFDSLDEATRTALKQAFSEGLTYGELANRRAVPLATIKSRIRRGLLRLRDVLDIVEAEPQRAETTTPPLGRSGRSPSKEAWPCLPTPATSPPT